MSNSWLGMGGSASILKPAIPILELFKYELKDIKLLTELVYYKLLYYFEKLGDSELVCFFDWSNLAPFTASFFLDVS